jgi:acetyl-CoA carboxylase biotin carboxyl carrier protein
VASKARTPRSGSSPDLLRIVREVVELAARHELAELEVEQRGVRVRVTRERPSPFGEPSIRTETPVSRPAAQPADQAASALPPNLVTIEAPMVGTFYRASSPEAAPFVSEGDLVKEGQVLCIIEAMKLMNEIESKVSGRIVKLLVENAQPVEYGHPLFLVDPSK